MWEYTHNNTYSNKLHFICQRPNILNAKIINLLQDTLRRGDCECGVFRKFEMFHNIFMPIYFIESDE